MALKAVHISELPNLDHTPHIPSPARTSSQCGGGSVKVANKFLVIGHRGNGMNRLESPDRRFVAVKENSILSFNTARKLGADFIEFDVQVLKDGSPVIFHDNFIFSEENGRVLEKRVTELSLPEFLSYGPQRQLEKVGKSLVRKTKDGEMKGWEVEKDDAMCTLREAFEGVDPCVGFNIELKFDDTMVYEEDHLIRTIQSILGVVSACANERGIIYSSFHPDAALLVRKLQTRYPVLFLTNGGCEVYSDVRRNSLEAAMEVCFQNELQGIVSEVKAILLNPKTATTIIRDSNLSLLTYGDLNNVVEVVRMQQVMGVEGVIVDLVEEVVAANQTQTQNQDQDQDQLSFLRNLIPVKET